MLRPSEARLAKGLYWDRAWSLVEGCTPVSPGCDHCWAAQAAHMRAQNPNPKVARANAGLTDSGRFTGTVRLRSDRLDLPLRTARPAVWAIWTDLFHESVPSDFIYDTLEIIEKAPWHVFLLLTKRPERADRIIGGESGAGWQAPPLKNLWFGFTAENQAWFDRRWPYARLIPAAVHFVSYEPALGPLILPEDFLARGSGAWVVAGGESGPQARPLHPDWARRVRADCRQFGVPFFFKQWGEWLPLTQWEDADCFVLPEAKMGSLWPEGRFDKNLYPSSGTGEGPEQIYRIGKKAAGRLLDGRTWEELPHG